MSGGCENLSGVGKKGRGQLIEASRVHTLERV